MTFYRDYEYNLLDRFDLSYSVYIAALDVQFCCDMPYLWTFTFDSTGEVIFGRDWQQLNEFFEKLESFGYTEDHKLIIYLNDLTQYFIYGKKYIDINEELLAKSPSQILIFGAHGLEFRDFMAYTEKDIDDYIYINDNNAKNYHIPPDCENLSSGCELTESELDYCSRRVLEMTKVIRYDVNMLYEGNTRAIKTTKTRRIENIMAQKMRQHDEDKQLYWHIFGMNPISSEWGREVLLPQLRKAFFGGTTFYEKGILNELFSDVNSADLVSAYCAEFVTSKFPMSRFKVMDVPERYQDLFEKPYYTKKALLIQFEAHNVKLKKNAIAVIPSAMRHYYINVKDKEERLDAIERAKGLKLTKSKKIKMCLTDIDFELFCRYYDFDDDLQILSVMGARYGYLPDYIILTVAELYKNKMKAKETKKELKKLGLLDDLQEEIYDESKSSLARLYGIFTQSPIVCDYKFDKETKDIRLVDSNYLMENHKFRPVVYQWGVWTVAHVRKKLCSFRDKLRSCKIKTLSGDTDCVNFVGNADNIISSFNEKINSLIARRCEQIGLDPSELKDLGTLEVEKYKYYRLTSLKQYAIVRETESGDVFEPKCGGMDKQALIKYFENYSLKNFKKIDAKKEIDHFRLGLTIPAKDKPRKIKRQCGSKRVDYFDRDGNHISADVPSYQVTEYKRFIICDVFSALARPEKPSAAASSDIAIGEVAALINKTKTKTPERKKRK